MTYFFFRQAILFSCSLPRSRAAFIAQSCTPARAASTKQPSLFTGYSAHQSATSSGGGRYLWVGTESGVARLDPGQSSGLNSTDWVTFTEFNGLGRGAISALDAIGDTVWGSDLGRFGHRRTGREPSKHWAEFFSRTAATPGTTFPTNSFSTPPRSVLSAALARPSKMLVLTFSIDGRGRVRCLFRWLHCAFARPRPHLGTLFARRRRRDRLLRQRYGC